MPSAPGQVPVGVDVDPAVFVGLPDLPPDRVETRGRQGHQRVSVRGEAFHDGRVRRPVVAPRAGQPVAAFEHDAGELPVGLGLQGRDHEVAAQEPDRVLHTALLAAGIRVAEPGLDPVAGKERVEHLGERHMPLRVAVSRSGGVVEHEHGRHAADVPEHQEQPVAQAFRVLPGHARHVPHVRVGERDHQAVVLDPFARDPGPRHPEIDLRGPGRPLQFAVSVRRRLVGLPPPPHVPLGRGVLPVVVRLGQQTVVDPARGVPLLAGHQPVGLQPPVHQMRVRVDLRTVSAVHRRLGGAVLHARVPRDRGTVHVQPARYLGMGHALPVKPPDILLFGHRYRQYPFLPESRRLQPADEPLFRNSGI